jgi:ribosomal protein L13
MKTYVAKEQETPKKWVLVDAESKVLGRLASQIAIRLRGKHKPIFTPHELVLRAPNWTKSFIIGTVDIWVD